MGRRYLCYQRADSSKVRLSSHPISRIFFYSEILSLWFVATSPFSIKNFFSVDVDNKLSVINTETKETTLTLEWPKEIFEISVIAHPSTYLNKVMTTIFICVKLNYRIGSSRIDRRSNATSQSSDRKNDFRVCISMSQKIQVLQSLIFLILYIIVCFLLQNHIYYTVTRIRCGWSGIRKWKSGIEKSQN